MTLTALGAGGWVIVVVALVLLGGVVYGFYTRQGSGIAQHPKGRRRADTAPGAQGRGETSGRDEGEHADVQHGTR
jgi:hypothetical protein